MSLATICGVTVLRSLVISILAVFVSRHLSKLVEARHSKRSFLLFAVILAPLLVPDLIVGYVWSLMVLKLAQYPFLIELVYSSLVLLKVVPVGIICFCFAAPPLVTSEADFIRKSVRSASAQISGVAAQWSFFFWKNVLRSFPIWALLFLLAFQEFEMASLIYRDSWTVSIFDAQARGVPLHEALSFLTVPLCVELLLVTGVAFLLSRMQKQPQFKQHSDSINNSSFSQMSSLIYLLIAFLVIVLIPFSLTGGGGLRAIGSLFRNQLQLLGILQESGWGLLYGITAGIAAWGLASFFFSENRSRQLKMLGLICCLPGLCGSLTLALVMASLFLSDYGHWLYDTPVPLFITLVLFLFPRAAFLKLTFRSQWQREPLFLARLLSHSPNQNQMKNGGRLQWIVSGRMQYWAVVLLAFWAYWDVTISSILAPNNAMTSSVRLYNLMHYGQNSILSAMTFLSFCIPVLVSLLLLPIVKKLWMLTLDQKHVTKTVSTS